MPRVKTPISAERPTPPTRRVQAERIRMQDRPGRWKLLWRRRRRLLRPTTAGAGLVIMVLLAFALPHALGRGASLTERFGNATAALGLRIQNVVVQGRVRTPDIEVATALSARPGLPILTFSVADARARLEQVPWIQSATVERRLPGTILVQLTERRPFAVWQLNGKFTLVDRDGAPVTDSDVASFASQLPLIVGVGAPQAAAALVDALATQPDIAGRLVAAVRVGGRRWNLRLRNGADVRLPEGAEMQALAKLEELQTSQAVLDRPLQTIDLRLPDRLMLRAQADRPTPPPPPTTPPQASPPTQEKATMRKPT